MKTTEDRLFELHKLIDDNYLSQYSIDRERLSIYRQMIKEELQEATQGKSKDELVATVFEMRQKAKQANQALERYACGSLKRGEDLDLTEISQCLAEIETTSDFVD